MKHQPFIRVALALLLAFTVSCINSLPPVNTVLFPTDLGDTLRIALPGHVPQETVPDPVPEIDQFVRAEMEKQHIVGLGLGVVRGGRVLYVKGYGWQDRELQVPVRSNVTKFRWASLSKMLTAVAAFQLACPEGPVLSDSAVVSSPCLDLNADIETYLSEMTPFDSPKSYLAPCLGFGFAIAPTACSNGFIEAPLDPAERVLTLGQLLSHRAGIQHYQGSKSDGCATPVDNPTPPYSLRGLDFSDALAYVNGTPLVVKPGTRYCYSTFGFSVAGQVIEDFTGNQFDDQIKDRIAHPLGMKTLGPDTQGLANRATGYRIVVGRASSESEEDIGFLAPPPEIDVVRDGDGEIRYKLPGGGFLSTVEDLTLFCRGLIDQSLLPKARKEAMWSIPDGAMDNTSARFGFFVGSRKGHRQVSHTGRQKKANCRLQLYPDEGLCVVVMTNTTGAGVNVGSLVNGVEDIVRSLPITDLTVGGLKWSQR